jgi:hypothetical protein
MNLLKQYLPISIFVLVFVIQSCKQVPEYAVRITRFAYDTVLIDNKTPMKELIHRLESPWNLVETGAGYWIGYTDDMFSIAHYGDKAIEPLISFIENTDSIGGKIGGIFSLHLIGINSHVAGRNYEEFVDTLARQALIHFIDDPKLHRLVMLLLRRDPWAYDMPDLVNYLSIPNRDYSFVMNAMRRYALFNDFIPLWQPLPNEILDKEIDVYTNSDQSNYLICNIIAIQKALNEKVIIDKDILESKEWEDGLECFEKKTYPSLTPCMDVNNVTTYIKPQIRWLEGLLPLGGNYTHDNEDILFYAYKNDSIYFYTSENARKEIIKFWNTLSDEKILQLTGRYMQLASAPREFSGQDEEPSMAVQAAPAPAGDSLLVSRFLPTRE